VACRAFEEEARCEVNIRLPLAAPKVLMAEIAEAAAVGALVRSTPNISSVYVLPPSTPGGTPTVQTDGINFQAAWQYDDVLDPSAATCNDIMHTYRAFGVEAARGALVAQVRAVFGAYGISVDARHLSLIADFMTSGGGYRGCSRQGISTCTSPLLKMSFETSAVFLTEAAVKGTTDSLGSAASKIVLGQPVGLGTGAVAVMNVFAPDDSAHVGTAL
jgi:DNA-directed RNA polymerase I subunit RPA1